jgi:hypothetical protein
VSVVLQDFTLKGAFHFIDGLLGSAVLRMAQTVTAAFGIIVSQVSEKQN